MNNQIENALVKFEYKEPTMTQLAQHIGFNDDELKMLKVFWEPVFNKSWIYLSPSMITKDMGYSKVYAFYRDTLRKYYAENIDYKEVSNGDQIVQSYQEFEEKLEQRLISVGDKVHTGGKTPKYYLVTGRTLKKMLMKAKTSRGDAICDYYLKVEELAMFMREYIRRCAIYHEELKLLTEVKCDDTIKSALVKYEYKEPTMTQLAQHIGFNDDELKMLQIFWEPVFNKSWIYLSPSMITKDMGYSRVNDFYKNTLYTQYTENKDYKSVEPNDPMVQSYQKFTQNVCCALILSKHKDTRGGHNTNYYLVTGRTLKKMLMKTKTKRGNAICEYYLKVEELAMFMKDYISAMHQYLGGKKVRELQEQINQKDNRSKLLDAFAEHVQERKPTGWYYIATSAIYAKKKFFKLGITNDLEARLRQYNCERPEDDMIYYAFIHNCHEPKQIENKIKFLLKDFQSRNKHKKQIDETYFMNYHELEHIVKCVCDNYDKEIDTLNKMVQTYKTSIMTDAYIPPSVYSHTLTITEQKHGHEIKQQTIDVTNLTEIQKKEYLIRAIEIFCTNNKMKYNHETDKDTDKKITLIWKDIQTILKQVCNVKKLLPTLWKTQLKNIDTDSQSIQRIKWVKK